jgi:hypothetical protein
MIKYMRMGWVGHLTHIGENRNALRVMMGNRIDRHGLEDNIKIEIREIGCHKD